MLSKICKICPKHNLRPDIFHGWCVYIACQNLSCHSFDQYDDRLQNSKMMSKNSIILACLSGWNISIINEWNYNV